MSKDSIIQISLIAIIAFPYIEKVKECLYPSKTFKEGKIEGYEDAKKELHAAAKNAVAKTFKYIKNDADESSTVKDIFLQDKIKIMILPQWELELLGDEYIVRSPFRASWKKAWLMTKSDSHEMDRQIEALLSGTKFSVNLDKTGITRQEIIQSTHRMIDEKKGQCLDR